MKVQTKKPICKSAVIIFSSSPERKDVRVIYKPKKNYS